MNIRVFLLISGLCLCSLIYGQTRLLLSTSKGDMVVELYDETPKHRDNFIKLAKKGFYDSTLFHRVIKDFMIQAGDPNSKGATAGKRLGNGGPGYTLSSEIDNQFIHKKGVLAAARQPDNTNPNRRSSGSQFYIVQGRRYPKQYLSRFEEARGEPYKESQKETYQKIGGTPHLDGQYTIFGEVLSGLEVLDQIAAMPTGTADRPQQNVYIVEIKPID